MTKRFKAYKGAPISIEEAYAIVYEVAAEMGFIVTVRGAVRNDDRGNVIINGWTFAPGIDAGLEVAYRKMMALACASRAFGEQPASTKADLAAKIKELRAKDKGDTWVDIQFLPEPNGRVPRAIPTPCAKGITKARRTKRRATTKAAAKPARKSSQPSSRRR
jgi:hypothetical protein